MRLFAWVAPALGCEEVAGAGADCSPKSSSGGGEPEDGVDGEGETGSGGEFMVMTNVLAGRGQARYATRQ